MKPHHIFHLIPATWDQYIHNYFLWILANKPNMVYILSLFADVFVIAYPIWLIYIYLVGHINDKLNYKKLSLQVLTGVLTAFAINIGIQYFVRKDRPDFLGGINLIFKHVPDNSFPSDHMAVGLVFWLVIIISKYVYDADYVGSKVIKNTWIIFLILGFVMWFCRVAIGVHRFTDICMWIVVGSFSSYVVYILDPFLDKYIYKNIIWLQNWLFDKLYIDKILK